MRSGPKPLSLHLGLASLASAGMAGAGAFTDRDRLDFFEGLKRYQSYPAIRQTPRHEPSWQAGTASLRGSVSKEATPVILVPSMINKSDILDLLQQKSLLRWLEARGLGAKLFDWGTPCDDPGQRDVKSAVEERLVPALESVGRPVILIGYCMGGLFSLAACAIRPNLIAGIVLLATPWNFHDQAGALRARLSLMEPLARYHLSHHKTLPESWMQATFATLDPESTLRKFAGFARMDQDDPKADLFVAVEDWLNDGLDLPSEIAKTCFEDWYRLNKTYSGAWMVGDHPVRADAIKARSCVVAARHDKIVPLDAALAFADQRAKCDRVICDTGHIGLLAGSKAETEIWPRIAEWITAHDF